MLEALWSNRKSSAPQDFLSHRGNLIRELLWSRGFESNDQAESFLNPRLENLRSPFTLRNMKEAVERLCQALEQQETIVVYSDYDMDGMSGLALLKSFLEAVGFIRVISYQPHRFDEGYGVHPEAIEELAKLGAQIIITVDTGISARDAAITAKRLGMTMIITDHHKQVGELPDTPFVINPNQSVDTSGLRELSGVGVAFFLCMALRSELRAQGYFSDERSEPDLKLWLDLFTLGTIADSVPLVSDNRALVRVGLKQLSQTERPGIRALLDLIFEESRGLSSRDVGFSLTPKLNAASRMGKAELATELLLTNDVTRAQTLAEELMRLNDQRSQIQAQVFEEALGQAEVQVGDHNPPVIVAMGDWHEGVLGVVAAKLVEKFRRPSLVLTRLESQKLRGSMRSVTGFSAVRALEGCGKFLERFGGHSMAAGLQMKAHDLEAFSSDLWTGTRSFFEKLDRLFAVEYDGEIDPNEIRLQDIEELQEAGPWGQGNLEPLFLVKELDLASVKLLKGQHLKCQINDRVSAIGFFKAADLEKLKTSGTKVFDALVVPEINRFRGQKSVQLRVQYVRPSQTQDRRPGPGPRLS